MVQVFAKRFWGFDPQLWPIVSFGLQGNRDALIRASKPGDLVTFIGTEGAETAAENRGRLLGLAEIGRAPLRSTDYLDLQTLRPIDSSEDGLFKWPWSLPIVRAWRFAERPRVTDVLAEQLSYEATVRAVLLDDRDAEAVLALAREVAPVRDLDVVVRQRGLSDALSSKPTRGPTPSSWTGEVSRDATAPSVTYALRFGTRNVWKVGHAQEPGARAREVNTHVPHEVLNEAWSVFLTHPWPMQTQAFDMEQRIFRLLDTRRSVGERLACTQKELESAWAKAMLNERP